MKRTLSFFVISSFSIIFSGCMSAYVRPLGQKSLVKSTLPQEKSFEGTTIILDEPPFQEIVYLISQSYPDAFVVVKGAPSVMRDSYTSGAIPKTLYDNNGHRYRRIQSKDRTQQRGVIELNKYLLFHNRKMTTTDVIPYQITNKACFTITWVETEWDEFEGTHSTGYHMYNTVAWISHLIDLTGLVCLPAAMHEDMQPPPSISLETSAKVEQIKPDRSSVECYRAGFAWFFLAELFTKTDARTDITMYMDDIYGPQFNSSSYANNLNKTFESMSSDSGLEYLKDKKETFEQLYKQRGFDVHLKNNDIKTTCLISRPNSQWMYYWDASWFNLGERSDDIVSKNVLRQVFEK